MLNEHQTTGLMKGRALMLFFKNKEEPVNKTSLSKSAAGAGKLAQPVNADDFFKDLDRKKKPKKIDMNIEVPEVKGLREAPLPPPGSTINNIAAGASAVENLIDKNTVEDDFVHGDIKLVDTSRIDTDSLIDKTAENAEELLKAAADRRKAERLAAMPAKPLSADDFFKDIDSRKKTRRVDPNINVPEVTGLREAPLPPAGSTINNIAADAAAAENLIDKNTVEPDYIRGDINLVDISTIDTSVLRDEAEASSDDEPEDNIIVI